ncbi:MAG: hypothetical protein NT023_07765, partial [Armatimonadetes bacterium]|nr:hypothetical protein [Armatimonadota bacterium]
AWAEEFLRCSFVTLTVLHKPYFLLRNPDFLAKVLLFRKPFHVANTSRFFLRPSKISSFAKGKEGAITPSA